jgi:hypothetical protein
MQRIPPPINFPERAFDCVAKRCKIVDRLETAELDSPAKRLKQVFLSDDSREHNHLCRLSSRGERSVGSVYLVGSGSDMSTGSAA